MCSESWNNYPKNYRDEDILKCPACGEDVDEAGDALSGCEYSPIGCKTCESAPCDGSC